MKHNRRSVTGRTVGQSSHKKDRMRVTRRARGSREYGKRKVTRRVGGELRGSWRRGNRRAGGESRRRKGEVMNI
jgi:hypothetical protein